MIFFIILSGVLVFNVVYNNYSLIEERAISLQNAIISGSSQRRYFAFLNSSENTQCWIRACVFMFMDQQNINRINFNIFLNIT